MNKDNAHLYLPLVQALAEGKTIQLVDDGRWSDCGNLEFMYPADHYRIKPEPKTAWYRVAETNFGPITANSKEDEIIMQASGFKRWLTDRITYEVTE